MDVVWNSLYCFLSSHSKSVIYIFQKYLKYVKRHKHFQWKGRQWKWLDKLRKLNTNEKCHNVQVHSISVTFYMPN